MLTRPSFRPQVGILATCAALASLPAAAQTAPKQEVRPPKAQAWIDVATFSGFGIPMGGSAMGGNPMDAALGSLLGGGGAGTGGNEFGRTEAGMAGRWVDVTVYSRADPALAEAEQAVPTGLLPSPLKLQAPKTVRGTAPDPDRDEPVEREVERPKGRLLMYWGCGAAVRAGQPKVLDMASASVADLGKFFVSRRATQRGAHAAPGRPVWPSLADRRLLPASASLAGEHRISGTSLPADWHFRIPAEQDLMPALELHQTAHDGGVDLQWRAPPAARAYFVAAMGAGAKEEMILWTSSEQPDTGMGLVDYQTNTAIDRWLKEGVVLPPSQTRCSVPQGVFPGGENAGAMLRLIAYGSELNLAYPPRPADPREPWVPDWAVKVRVKSVASAMLGSDAPAEVPTAESPAPAKPDAPQPDAPAPALPDVKDLLKGLLGR